MGLPPSQPSLHFQTPQDLGPVIPSSSTTPAQSNAFLPFTYPSAAFGLLIVVTYLLIDHRNRPWLRQARFLVWGVVVGLSSHAIMYQRARARAVDYAVGLSNLWLIAWSGCLLVLHDCQADFERVEKVELEDDSSANGVMKEEIPEDPTEKSREDEANGEVREGSKAGGRSENSKNSQNGPSRWQKRITYRWQPYPTTSFIARLSWIMDLLTNFRGPGWNWQISSLPPLPAYIQRELDLQSGADKLTNGKGSPKPTKPSVAESDALTDEYPSRSQILRAHLYTFIHGYIALDILKHLFMNDPYYLGLIPVSSPVVPPHLSVPLSIFPTSTRPTLLKSIRLTLTMYAVRTAVLVASKIPTLILLSLPSLFPTLTTSTLFEPYLYHPTWGPSLLSSTFALPLANWWGRWWHQLFRYGFDSYSHPLISFLHLQPRSSAAKMLRLFVVFGLSGLMHAAGSWTMIPPTRPLSGPFTFFMLQGVGIAAETILGGAFSALSTRLAKHWPFIGNMKIPNWLKTALSVLVLAVWFYHTSPFLCDDFARGGLWYFEPVPVSFLRILGLRFPGALEQISSGGRWNWWRWGGPWVRWEEGTDGEGSVVGMWLRGGRGWAL
ncbi:hypothetical protein K402DRAFT_398919 [Aulographum hederae CBS 113979]|uniref:Wax synthase domain-containing protein n=1 Tax=Aulographum hederae CBS 113979 TaxID=1176131 RepID=A0A6G1GJD0_9PEZI|nr:hypothetical protein K402DRAFT_398919 [Aulographum hederae CBS 113979]